MNGSKYIIGSVVTHGCGNTINVNYKDNDFNDVFNNTYWDKIENEFSMLMDKLDNNSNELHLIESAYNYIKNRNEKGLKHFIREHGTQFASNVFSSVASDFLVSFIRGLI